MAHLPQSTFKETFVEGFARTAQLGLLVGGYAILAAVVLAALIPSLPVFEAVVDGTALKAMGFVSAAVLLAGIASGVIRWMNQRPKTPLVHTGRTQLAK